MIEILKNLSDEDLVKKVREGNDKAFEILVKRYEAKIYALILRFIDNQSTASDILQETFLKVYRSLNNFRGDAKFSTWLYKIAVNFCLMYKRKKGKTVSLDSPVNSDSGEEIKRELPDWSITPEVSTENIELRKKLEGAISMLSEEYKSVIILHDIQGLSNKEVSRILNISIPAVKSRVHRARLFLREKLSEYFKQTYD